ncbi:MAG: branched-chain amino acid ABC transporter permease [Inquilinaceae bacterium]
MENYLIALVTTGALYALLALGLNIMWGLTGMINLGLAGFFAFGAYVSAIATTRGDMPILVGVVLAILGAAAAGAILAAATLRLRGDYLAIVTLGFAETIRLIASNEIWLTNGIDGISGIPGPLRGSLSPQEFNLLFCVITLAVVGAVLLAAQRLARSPYGRVLRAIRDDEQVAAVAGKPVRRFKVEAFAIGAGVMGLAGALYGHFNSYVAPDIFRPLITIYIFLALTAGGTGNNRGAIVGAALVIVTLEASRFMKDLLPFLTGVQLAAFREILIGTILILVMRFRPQGLLPERPSVLAEPSR